MNDMSKIMREVKIFMDENRLIYKGINVSELLLPHIYTSVFNKNKSEGLIKEIKNIAKKILLYLPYRNLTIKKHKFSFRKKYKFLFSFGFLMNDHRHSSLLKNLIKKINKEDVLILTDKKDVFIFYKERNYSVIYLHLPKICSENNNIFNDFDFIDINGKWLLGKAIPKIKYLDILYSKINIETVISSQDFHIFDQINIKLGKKYGYKTITHQHGMINEPHPGLFKYVFSDKIFLWGINSKKRLRGFVDEEKLLVAGTTKFNYLLSETRYKEEYITLALNPISKKINKKIIQKFLDLCTIINLKFQNEFKFVIKLHPGLDKKEWLKLIGNFNNEINIIIEKENNKEILNKSKILIAYNSTISLEAMICNCSVMELNFGQQNTSKLLFENLEESIVFLEDLEKEVIRRINNKKYNLNILERQNNIVHNEIKTFDINYELELLSKI